MSEILNKPEVAKIYIDARGPRFAASITTVVLAIALVTQSTWVLALQGLVFLIGAVRGPQFTPYGLIFKTFIKPRLKKEAPTEREKSTYDEIKDKFKVVKFYELNGEQYLIDDDKYKTYFYDLSS